MSVYVELDPEVALKALEGHENVLEGEKRKQDAFYRQFACPRCGGGCQRAFISIQHAFPQGTDDLLPRQGLKCSRCNCLFDPHSGIVVETGT